MPASSSGCKCGRSRCRSKDGVKTPTRILSHIYPVHLDESIGSGQGKYASVSVLEPVIRIERSRPMGAPGRAKSTYRIIVHFILQFSINHFERFVPALLLFVARNLGTDQR